MKFFCLLLSTFVYICLLLSTFVYTFHLKNWMNVPVDKKKGDDPPGKINRILNAHARACEKG